MKSRSLFLIASIFLIFALSSVSAVVVYGEWEDGSQNTIITDGDDVDFNVAYFTMNPPMAVSIKLYDQQNELIHTFEENLQITNPEFARDYTLENSMYSGIGNYLVVLRGEDSKGVFSQSLNLNVQPEAPENQAPRITSQPVVAVNETCPNEETVRYTYDVNAVDADGDTLTYSLTQAPSWLSINAQTGVISGNVPSVSADTQFTITVRVEDGKGGSDTQTYVLTVRNLACEVPEENNAPEITSNPVTTVNESITADEICPQQEVTYTYDVNAVDADGDTLTYSLTQAPSWLSINAQTGVISGTTPSVSSNTAFTVTVRVADGRGASDTQTYTLTVLNKVCVGPENHPPVIVSTPVTVVDEKENYRYDVDAIDPDNDTLVYSLIIAPSWLTINSQTGVITGTAPEVNADTQFTVSVRATDPHGASDTQTYVLTVKNLVNPPANQAPQITTDPLDDLGCNCDYLYDVNATDANGDTLIYSLVNSPSWLSINENTGMITGRTPSVNVDTDYTVTVRVTDSHGASDTQTYTLTVRNIPCDQHAPRIITVPVTKVNEGKQYKYDVNATDEDGDTLTYSIAQVPGTPAWLKIDANTGMITGTAPGVSQNTRTFQVTVTVNDGNKGTATQVYFLVVHNTDGSSSSSSDSSSSNSLSTSSSRSSDSSSGSTIRDKVSGIFKADEKVNQPIISQERSTLDEGNGTKAVILLSVLGVMALAALLASMVYSGKRKKDYYS